MTVKNYYSWAGGPVVRILPLRGRDREFNSHPAHQKDPCHGIIFTK